LILIFIAILKGRESGGGVPVENWAQGRRLSGTGLLILIFIVTLKGRGLGRGAGWKPGTNGGYCRGLGF